MKPLRPNMSDDIPFINPNPGKRKPFADLKGATGVDDPVAMLEGWTEPQIAIGPFTTMPAAVLKSLADRRRAVARVIVDQGAAMGTGFLVGKNLFVTNNHVLDSIKQARNAHVEFDYEADASDLLADPNALPKSEKTFQLDPDRLFVTSPFRGGLDFTFVWIDSAAAAEFAHVPMRRDSFMVRRGERAFIIHHPGGAPKVVSIDDADVLDVQPTVISYTTDTSPGSSGACVLDRLGRLIALHHASTRKDAVDADGRKIEFVNEGVKISAIALDLERRVNNAEPSASAAKTILSEIAGSDSLTGFFGGLGRRMGRESSTNAVVKGYRQIDADVDMGLWNVEGLADRWGEPARLNDATRMLADVNVDIWGLTGASADDVRTLAEALKETFNESYDCLDVDQEETAIAILWKESKLDCKKIDWPPAALDDFNLAMEEDDEAIFDEPPGLFRIDLAQGRASFAFNFLVTPFKASASTLRRRFAVRILRDAIRRTISAAEGLDWVIAGDIAAELAASEFENLADLGFTAMSAEDEQAGAGAFSYIRSPDSPIETIFLSPNLTRTAGRTDLFTLAQHRTAKALRREGRPVLLRASFAEADGMIISDTELDRRLKELRASQSRRPARVPRSRAGRPTARAARERDGETERSYQEALTAAERLAGYDEKKLFGILGSQIEAAGRRNQLQQAQSFDAAAVDYESYFVSTTQIGKHWWNGVQKSLLALVCEPAGELQPLTGNDDIPSWAADLAIQALKLTLGPPAWVLIAATILAKLVLKSGLDAMCKALQHGAAAPG